MSGFSAFYPRINPVSLLESKASFDIVTQLADSSKRPPSHLQSMG
jgi:hypothetical protein